MTIEGNLKTFITILDKLEKSALLSPSRTIKAFSPAMSTKALTPRYIGVGVSRDWTFIPSLSVDIQITFAYASDSGI